MVQIVFVGFIVIQRLLLYRRDYNTKTLCGIQRTKLMLLHYSTLKMKVNS